MATNREQWDRLRVFIEGLFIGMAIGVVAGALAVIAWNAAVNR